VSQFRIGIVTNEKENLRLLFKELEARARPNLFRFYFWLSFASQRHLHVPSGTGDITSFGFPHGSGSSHRIITNFIGLGSK